MKSLLSTTFLALCACEVHAAALPKIDGAALLEQITTLASDDFEGRAPGTHGEDMTIAYLQQQFKQLGLEPGNPDGGYLQTVPLVGISSHPTLSYSGKDGKPVQLRFGGDYIAWTARGDKQLDVANSELVFVGYGTQAPEFKWDDYKGADLKGKTLVMLINDPPVPDPKHPRLLDPAVFGGSAVTWYGRWNYKFEMAARMGAAAALIVHDKTAGYPYEFVVNSWGRENFALKSKAPDPGYPAVPGWLQQERACELFKAAGLDFKQLKEQALSRGFKPVPLGIKLNVSMLNATRDVVSHNVVARITGSDPQLKQEVVVYTAHWDHFGIDDTLPGPRTQQIFHGAVDNASGVAALLQLARAYKALPVAPKRTILFVATTAEERGLLGAQYYVRHPLYPLNKTVLNLNIDGLNLWGRSREVELSGMGKSSADELVTAIAARQGRVVRPDSNVSYGSYYRGDQLEFARAGVPTIYLRSSASKAQQYTTQQYHTVHDVVQPSWNLGGALEDISLLFQAGYQAAQAKDQPKWKDGAEFQRR
ncbi:Zn-dependent M28 family amino/carboxypeptidase [Duganella sp. 1224]|uniref:M20/M25/M40 family metallo-hydrolase n=1 Tax=Duganella sp. 1224 TaxID=2587052 RepID=UPI0015CE8C72|nr:M20/M25/M40 family metallo-hydrolase [Duganella sp. 1224]NYE64095.1 Zn-dependent M28 family amino/carboxypeptidase [Duganella sp. 1224]